MSIKRSDTPSSSRAISLQDIANRLGMAKSTISRALQNDSRISAATIALVDKVATEMGYDPAQNISARRLVMQKRGKKIINHVVGCIFPFVFNANKYTTNLLHGIMEELIEREYVLAICSTFSKSNDQPLARPMPASFLRGEMDGLLVMPYTVDITRSVELLRNSPGFGDRPIVSMITAIPGLPGVLTDDMQGAYDAAIHLLQHGHRHFVQFAVKRWQDVLVEPRIAGINRALSEYGFDPRNHLHIFEISPDWLNPSTLSQDVDGPPESWTSSNWTRQRLITFFAEHPEVTAIMARNDVSAIRAWYILEKIGKRIPQDISIVGFDDTDPKLNQYGFNTLTSVRLPFAEVGREASRLVLRLIDGEPQRAIRTVLPTELMARESTAPPQNFEHA